MLYLNDGDYFSGSLRDCPTAKHPPLASPRRDSAVRVRRRCDSCSLLRSAAETACARGRVLHRAFRWRRAVWLPGRNHEGRLRNRFRSIRPSKNCSRRNPSSGAGVVRRRLPIAAQTVWPNGRPTTSANGAKKPADWSRTNAALPSKSRSHIPEQAHFEFEIAWDKPPQFSLAFSASDKAKQLAEGFQIGSVGPEARPRARIRQVGRRRDPSANSTRTPPASIWKPLQPCHRRVRGSSRSTAANLAKITLPKEGRVSTCASFRLTNNGTEVSLEQLAVSQWNGRSPPKVDATKPRIHKKDGTIVYGDVTGYDAAAKQFLVTSDGKETRIDSAQVACIVQAAERQTDEIRQFRIGLHDGSRFSGDLAKVENEKLYLKRRGIDEPLACPSPNVRSLVGLKRESKSPPYTKDRTGRWESKGILSHGTVAAASPNSDPRASCLVWKPRWSTTASPLRSDVSGRIVYRDPPPPRKEGEEEETQRRAPRRRFLGAVTRALGSPAPPRQPQMSRGAGTLCLLTGDRIPCESIQIDEEGVHFTSSTVAADFVPHRVGESAGVRSQMDRRRTRRGQADPAADTSRECKKAVRPPTSWPRPPAISCAAA